MKTLKFFNLSLLFSFFCLFIVSCSDDVDGIPGGQGGGSDKTSVLVASADLLFQPSGESLTFECYREEGYGEMGLLGDTLMILRFRTTDKYGDQIDGPSLLINIQNLSGFKKGDVFESIYPFDSDGDFLLPSLLTNSFTTLSVIDQEEGKATPFQLTITDISANYIKGTFEGELIKTFDNTTKAFVTNGKFEGELYRQ